MPRPPVISRSPDVVTALIDKNTVAHNGMVHEPVSIFLPSLQNITSISVCWDGPNQLTRLNSIPGFQISSNGPVMNQRFGMKSSILHSSGFVRTQFSSMISLMHCLISSSASTFFWLPRGLPQIRLSLATIPLAVERFTPSASATNK